MAINLIEAWDINLATVKIKFEPSIKIATITNERFTLLTDAATPAVVSSDPFLPIDIEEDYDSIGKILVLTWKDDVLEPETAYKLKLSGFRNASNVLIPDDYIFFQTEESVEPDPGDIPIDDPEYVVEDHSILDGAVIFPESTTEDDDGETATFKLLDSDPLDNDAFLPEDYNNGILILKFDNSPGPEFLNEEYFIAQSKEIKRQPSRWETVDVEIEAHATKPWVLVKFPSNDATPVYGEGGKVYFEKNHKYRVKISEEVGY